MTLTCSAPGKLFLGGEYAVLRGAPAVITAVDRRAIAEVSEGDSTSRIVKATQREVGRYLEKNPGEIPNLSVNSPRFRIRGKKVGLGSSAASCAAAAGALFEWAGLPIDAYRENILETAMAAHRSAQSGKGSGGDVAVAVLGGTLVFSMEGTSERVIHPPPHMVAVWTGRSASTTHFLSGIEAFERRHVAAYLACLESLTQTAVALTDAYMSNNTIQIIKQTKAYGAAMNRLGTESGVPIVTHEHELVANLAADLGGGAKPSGAGGGDVAIALFEELEAMEAFKTTCIRFDLAPLDLKFHAPGLRLDGETD